MFCGVLYYLGAFGTVWLPYETRCKTGRTSSKVRETKSHRNFSQRTHPIHPIGPKTDFLVRFILFGCIRDRFVALRNSGQNGPNLCKSSCHDVTSNISQRTHPIHPIGPYTDVLVRSYYLGALGLFGCLTKLGAKQAE